MKDDHLISVAQLKEFSKLGNSAKFKSNSSKVETYSWIEKSLGKFRYFSLKKGERGIVKKYIVRMTGYSGDTIDKLIARKKKFGKIFVKERTQNTFQRFYGGKDVELLAEVSNVTLNQNGYALKEVFKSEIFGGFSSKIQCSRSVGKKRADSCRPMMLCCDVNFYVFFCLGVEGAGKSSSSYISGANSSPL